MQHQTPPEEVTGSGEVGHWAWYLSRLDLESTHHLAFLSRVFETLDDKDPEFFALGSEAHDLFVSSVASKEPLVGSHHPATNL